MIESIQKTRDSYDAVSAEYAAHFIDEMEHKPFDRKMLELLAEEAPSTGRICDLGCGPGNIARYLHKLGRKVCGVDLSGNLIQQAQALNPELEFTQADMLQLSALYSGNLAGIAAFYSVIHVPPALLWKALQEMFKSLQSGGVLLLTFHIGTETVHKSDWWDKPVDLDFHFFEVENLKASLERTGFRILYTIERQPVPEVEAPTRRAYLFARKP